MEPEAPSTPRGPGARPGCVEACPLGTGRAGVLRAAERWSLPLLRTLAPAGSKGQGRGAAGPGGTGRDGAERSWERRWEGQRQDDRTGGTGRDRDGRNQDMERRGGGEEASGRDADTPRTRAEPLGGRLGHRDVRGTETEAQEWVSTGVLTRCVTLGNPYPSLGLVPPMNTLGRGPVLHFRPKRGRGLPRSLGELETWGSGWR